MDTAAPPYSLDAILAAVRKAAAGEIAAAAAEVDRDRVFPAAARRALGACGALGLVIPREHGGAGGSLSALAEGCESVAAGCASSGMVFLMHSVAAATIAAGGGERAPSYLRGMTEGTLLGTLAFSERGTGAHFYAPELTATATNGAVHISGRKSFVTSGGHADVYLLLVRGDGHALDCFALERGTPGVLFDGSWDGLGMAGNSSVAMELADVELADAARIGSRGGGEELVFGTVAPFFLVGLAAVSVGIAAAAAAAATAHARTRRYPDGTALVDVMAIQHALADIDARVRQARLLVAEAARLGESGDEAALVAIMEAKVAATEAAAAVTERALEICGGQGYTSALPIERHLRDARAGAVMAPTNAVLRTWIGKALAGLPVP